MTLTMTRGPRESVQTVGKGDVSYRVDNLFGSVVERADGPQVFHVHQGAHDVTAPHFHGVPQFQVFTGGDGMFGRAAVAVPALHYADAWTAYGPIVAGPSGIDYFTARVHSDVGAGWMPEERKSKPHKSGRHFTVDLAAVLRHSFVGPKPLIGEHEDGLAATLVTLQEHDRLELPPVGGSGRLLTLLAGALVVDGQTYGEWAWGHASVGSGGTALHASGAGATVLCCDYPNFAWDSARTS